MNKKIKALSAVALILFTASGILTACDGKTSSDVLATTIAEATEKVTVIQSDIPYEIVSQNEAYTYFKPVTTQKSAMTYTYAPIPQRTTSVQANTMPELTVKEEENKNPEESRQNPSSDKTQKNTSDEVVEEKSKGISIVTKSSPVMSGNTATIMIQGKPNKKYSINFYESPSKKANYGSLESKTADSNGFVTWTFKIEDSCELGNRKVYIKEISSGNYLQTSIKVC